MNDLINLKAHLQRKQDFLFGETPSINSPENTTLLPEGSSYVQQIIDAVSDHDIVILVGAQGTGKTTAAYQALSALSKQGYRVSIPALGNVSAGGENEITYVSYLTGRGEGATKETIFEGIQASLNDQDRTLVLEYRAELADGLISAIRSEWPSLLDSDRVLMIDFCRAATQSVAEQLAKRTLSVPEHEAGTDLVSTIVERGGQLPVLTLAAARLSFDTDWSTGSVDVTKKIDESLIETHIPRNDGPEDFVSSLEVLAITGAIDFEIYADIVDLSANDMRVLSEVEEYIIQDWDEQEVELRSPLLSRALIRRVLDDAHRREELGSLPEEYSELRDTVDQVVRELVKVATTARKRGDEEDISGPAVEFISRWIQAAKRSATTKQEWASIAGAIDICARHRLPVSPTVFVEQMPELLSGYERYAKEGNFTPQFAPTGSKIAANNFGQLLLSWYSDPSGLSNTGRDDIADAATGLINTGKKDGNGLSPIEFWKNVFGQAVRSATFDDPDISEEEIVELERMIRGEVIDRSTGQAKYGILSDVEADSREQKHDEIVFKFWAAATAKVFNAHQHEADSLDRWMSFSADRIGEIAESELEYYEPQNFVVDYYVRVGVELLKMSPDDGQFPEGAQIFKQTLLSSIETHAIGMNTDSFIEKANYRLEDETGTDLS
jgi:Cdc6-like AAA superfamily ATPase